MLIECREHLAFASCQLLSRRLCRQNPIVDPWDTPYLERWNAAGGWLRLGQAADWQKTYTVSKGEAMPGRTEGTGGGRC